MFRQIWYICPDEWRESVERGRHCRDSNSPTVCFLFRVRPLSSRSRKEQNPITVRVVGGDARRKTRHPAHTRRRDPFALPDAALARSFGRFGGSRSFFQIQTSTNPSCAADERPCIGSGSFFTQSDAKAKTYLKRNCEHYCTCIDKQSMFLYL